MTLVPRRSQELEQLLEEKPKAVEANMVSKPHKQTYFEMMSAAVKRVSYSWIAHDVGELVAEWRVMERRRW